MLQITDANGRHRSETVVANPGLNQVTLDVSALKDGIYMVEVKADGQAVASERLLVQRP